MNLVPSLRKVRGVPQSTGEEVGFQQEGESFFLCS